MNTLAELSIFPMDKGESVSAYVARAVSVIRESGLPYELGPMGTSIEGEWEEVMDTVNRCMHALRRDCHRIYMTLKVDYRQGRQGAITEKIASVEKQLEKVAT